MIETKNLAYGNVNEIAAWVVEKLNVMKGKHVSSVRRVDFTDGILDEPQTEEELEKAYDHVGGWYGIRQVTMGFDNDDVELFSDYYGGGSGVYESIDTTSYTEDEVTKMVEQMMLDVLDLGESEGKMILAEVIG